MPLPRHKIRGFLGIKSNDGHDAPLLIVADALKQAGIEVILGGYDLTVDKFVNAIVQEGVQFAGISSYNGGHIPFFRAVRDRLQAAGHPHIHLIGGGGATFLEQDITLLEREAGIDKIFKSGEGGASAAFIQSRYNFSTVPERLDDLPERARSGDSAAVAQLLNVAEEKAWLQTLLDATSQLENGERVPASAERSDWRERIRYFEDCLAALNTAANGVTVYGIAGRGGCGKSTLLDELLFRWFQDARNTHRRVAVLAIDPSSQSTGGALLADRIAYMYATDKNWVDTDRIFTRSVAARGYGEGLARALPDMIRIFKASGYDVFVETYGIGQPDAGIVDLVDKAVLVTTPDLGGPYQLMKEELLNRSGVFVVLNKSELPGARRAQSLLRSRVPERNLFATTATEHRNPGVDALYREVVESHDR
ncbi:cobalamin-dependent protein [Nitrospina watsonii]|uniref:Methylmalonyl-CoA mutase, cobalamin-binding subunit n=1 Tax=Nitrospina watsonii TaxID=1323948 RepID=A0ABM9HGB8_9BACT|nr:cobalamin-dependent protein [Nitrospina watsonii]CAI2719332.1 Putative Methylmalonyl-CoA mutase, cobalamin-binding subunit [Nitrospina watsonii]